MTSVEAHRENANNLLLMQVVMFLRYNPGKGIHAKNIIIIYTS